MVAFFSISRKSLFNTTVTRYTRLLSTQSDPMVLERLHGKDKGIVLFRMNRPQTKNAISQLFLKQLWRSLTEVKFDKDARVIIIKSDVPGAFCTGADLKERKTMAVDEVPKFVDSLRSSFNEIERLPQPVIAAIDGFALGGGLEMALSCDIRVASAISKLGLTETKLAIMPGAGGTQRLARVVGPSLAKELIFTGRIVSAEDALRFGMINHCTQGDSYEKALEIAREIIARGPVAVRMAKLAINVGSQMDLNSGMVIEQQCYAQRLPYNKNFFLRSMHLSALLRVQKWDVMVSVVLWRPPIIAPPMTTTEQTLLAKRTALEFEGKDLSELDGQIGVSNAVRIDEWTKKAEQLNTQYHLSEPRMFQSSDERSLMRELDRKLVLIVKQRFGDDKYVSPWILPQMKNKSGESLRQIADFRWTTREEFWAAVPCTKYKNSVKTAFLE
uniref:Enoyl-CoA hydratase domain-containing protein 2, mitochondrial n=1 Tax=Heterorhabditis bacteriophora TaxID=37862 RepID=A0A1I7WN71_HETBA